VAPFDSADALESGRLSAVLKNAGTPIGHSDTLIAGHALSLKLTLVTNNVKHFSRVPELKVVNWLKD
jgi:tRNA(fMet)-specific endonuclease VapC